MIGYLHFHGCFLPAHFIRTDAFTDIMSEGPCPIESSKKAIKAGDGRNMTKINMNGCWFDGPYAIDSDDLPARAGVCLVCTESGYGIKVMSIEDAVDIKECIASNKRRDCWKRTAEKEFLDVYIALIDSREERAKVAKTVRERRKYKLPCEE